MSNVVKSSEAEGYSNALVFDFADVESRAASIVREATHQAADIMAGAKRSAVAELERAAEEGRELGRREGIEKGIDQGRGEGRTEAFEKASAELENVVAGMESALVAFAEKRGALFKEAQANLLTLSMTIARKVIAREIEADKHVTLDNLKRCLEILSGRLELTVRVAPALQESLSEALESVGRSRGELAGVVVEGDESVSAGGCVIVSRHGGLDASIETQLEEVERILFGKCDV